MDHLDPFQLPCGRSELSQIDHQIAILDLAKAKIIPVFGMLLLRSNSPEWPTMLHTVELASGSAHWFNVRLVLFGCNSLDRHGMVPVLMLPETKYFESHVTIEPVFGEQLRDVQVIASIFEFKVADLLMQRRAKDTPERSAKDTFCTGRHKNYETLFRLMTNLAKELEISGYKVWRQKIEAVVYDERTKKVEESMHLTRKQEERLVDAALGPELPASKIYVSPLKEKIQAALHEARGLRETIKMATMAIEEKEFNETVASYLNSIPDLIKNNKSLDEVCLIDPKNGLKLNIETACNLRLIGHLREALKDLGVEPCVISEPYSNSATSSYNSFLGIKLT